MSFGLNYAKLDSIYETSLIMPHNIIYKQILKHKEIYIGWIILGIPPKGYLRITYTNSKQNDIEMVKGFRKNSSKHEKRNIYKKW